MILMIAISILQIIEKRAAFSCARTWQRAFSAVQAAAITKREAQLRTKLLDERIAYFFIYDCRKIEVLILLYLGCIFAA